MNVSQDRTTLLKDVVSMSMAAAYGLQKLDEQQAAQVISGLVRTRLLSAEDSFRLRDELMNDRRFQMAIDSRIESALKRKGCVTNEMLEEIKERVSRIKVA